MLRRIIFGVLVILGVNTQESEKPNFSCQGRPSGYYADISSGCQIYHMCDGLGRQFSYSCPNTTLFQQRMLICDHWYMVNCSKAELDYGANLLIGQKGKPFVEDDAENPYHRTPRPDLLAHPSAAEYNIIYRSGRAQVGNNKNLVGGDTDDSKTPVTEQSYFLPSHWSTEYYPIQTEQPKVQKVKNKEVKKQTVVNFKSNFKATTPVYPKTPPTEQPLLEDDLTQNQPKSILQPPAGVNPGYPKQAKVNFQSNFKATTPVYPKFVTPETPFALEEKPLPPNNAPYGISTIIEPPRNAQQHVNFESHFKATTPKYPTSVTSEAPLAIEDVAADPNKPSLSSVIQPPKSFKENKFNTVQEPSIYYQPPALSKERTDKTNFDYEEAKLQPPQNSNAQIVNFKSDFKATTPVYPKTPPDEQPLLEEDLTQHQLISILQPPRQQNPAYPEGDVHFQSNFKATTPVYPKVAPSELPLLEEDPNLQPPNLENPNYPKVNFQSNFKATTPVYPKFVTREAPFASEEGLLQQNGAPNEFQPPTNAQRVNFQSNFKATTPVYPEVSPSELPLLEDSNFRPPNIGSANVNFQSNFKATTPVYPKIAPTELPLLEEDLTQHELRSILQPPTRENLSYPKPQVEQQPKVNFQSNYKATTPVYPKFVTPEVPLALEEQPVELNGAPYGISSVIEPPRNAQPLRIPSLAKEELKVNFQSNFKATTPVYPRVAPDELPLLEEDLTQHELKSILQPPSYEKLSYPRQQLQEQPKVNFQSDFKATTPVYPKFVTPEVPLAFEEQPLSPNNAVYGIGTVIEPPRVAQPLNLTSATIPLNNQDSIRSEVPEERVKVIPKFGIDEPSIYYQPPALPSNDERYDRNRNSNSNPDPGDNWKELRRSFLIPDYEFPLDPSAVRPSYTEALSSFQASPLNYELMPRNHA